MLSTRQRGEKNHVKKRGPESKLWKYESRNVDLERISILNTIPLKQNINSVPLFSPWSECEMRQVSNSVQPFTDKCTRQIMHAWLGLTVRLPPPHPSFCGKETIMGSAGRAVKRGLGGQRMWELHMKRQPRGVIFKTSLHLSAVSN